MASISTPTQLATFSQPHASSSKTPHVTLSPVVGDSKCAVAAVRGDGIWTYDLNTLRPTTSFTVPPSTVFSTSPISYWVTRTERAPRDQSQRVVQVVENDMDVDEEEGSEEEEEEETVEVKERITLVGVGKEIWKWVGEEGDKEVIEIGKPIKSIHHLPSSLYPILVITSNPTDLHLLNTSFKHTNLPLSLPSAAILTSKILSSKENSARLVIADSEGKVSVFQLILEDTPRMSRVSEGKIGGTGKLGCVDISDDGVISALDQSNNLYTLELSSLSIPAAPLTLVHPSSSPVLLSLSTAGKPLILLPTSHPTPSLLLSIPLSTLPAILSCTSISSFTSSGTVEHLAILSSKNGILTVGVVLSHLNSDGQSGRSVIYTTEVVIPPKGIGMGSLLGTKEKTQIYLSTPTSKAEEKKGGSGTTEQDGLIKKISELIKKNQLGAAENALKEHLSKADSAQVSEGLVRKIINVVFTEALNDEGKVKGNYAAGVVRELVEKGLVNDSMWKTSLIGEGLLPCGDWNTIILCLQKFRTISSLTLVKLISSSLHPSSTDKNVPTLSHLLSSIMSSPPAPTFRLDLRQNLSVEDATSVLAQFVSWAGEHVKLRGEGLKGWDSEDNQNENVNTDIPSLNSLITYSSLLLDSHLPLFLSHEPSHELLEALDESLIPLMEVQNEYKKLRGPIEAILILAKREEMKQQENQGKSSRGDKKGTGTGTRIPEERIGKWKVEDLVF